MRGEKRRRFFNQSTPLVAILLIVLFSTPARTQNSMHRRIGCNVESSYFLFDEDFFGIDNGIGANVSLRYEIGWNIYFENTIGGFAAKSADVDVSGMDYGLTLAMILPYWIPYRPIVRAGVGFISVNPKTVNQIGTYRPTQTTFHFITGAGISKSLRENIELELMANAWIAPYLYRIYTFDRSSVKTEDAQFTHLNVTLGLSFLF